MTSKKLLLAIILIAIGLLGVFSILTMELPIPAEAEAILKARFTDFQIQLLLLINPTLMLLIAVAVGTALFQKVNLGVPIIERFIGIKNDSLKLSDILKYGLLGGLLSGILLSLVGLIFNPILPAEFLELGESFQPSLAARFLYGGLTEEILMRFGLMTCVVWLLSLMSKNKTPLLYWIGILISAIIFGIGHFPIAFQSLESPSVALLSYILIGNSIGGIVFGWLYWKKGLEAAFIAHIITHVVMLMAESINT